MKRAEGQFKEGKVSKALRSSAKEEIEGHCDYGNEQELKNRWCDEGGWRGECWDVIAWRAVQVKATDGGVFVAIVGPIFFWVQLRQSCFILRQFIFRGEGIYGFTRGEWDGLDSLWILLIQRFGWRGWLILGEPPTGFGAEGGGGGSSQGAGVRHRAEGEVQLPEESEVLATTLGWRGANQVWWGDAGFAEPLPQGTGFTTAGPWVAI